MEQVKHAPGHDKTDSAAEIELYEPVTGCRHTGMIVGLKNPK